MEVEWSGSEGPLQFSTETLELELNGCGARYNLDALPSLGSRVTENCETKYGDKLWDWGTGKDETNRRTVLCVTFCPTLPTNLAIPMNRYHFQDVYHTLQSGGMELW